MVTVKAVLFAGIGLFALFAWAAAASLKAQASSDFIRVTAYTPEAHDVAFAWVDCPDVYRTSQDPLERRQHQFEWRVRACGPGHEGPCMCEAGVTLGLRGKVVARQTTVLIVPF